MSTVTLHSKKKKTLVPKLRFPEFDGEWKQKKVGELCDSIVPGRNKPTNFKGEIPWITTPDIEHNGIINYSKKGLNISKEEAKKVGSKIVPINSIIISCVGDLGLSAITGKEIIINQQLHAFIPKEKIEYRYLLYQLNLKKKYMDRVATKTAVPYMNKDNCNSIPIDFPNLPEQQKIASFLSAVYEKMQQLSRKKELLEQYKKGLMQQLFSGKLRFKDENGKDYADWEEKKLGDVAKFRRGSFPQPYGLPKWYDDENGMPFIQVYDVDHNMLLKKTTKNKISKLGAEQSVFVKKGTLVITIQGSIGRIAKTQYDAYVDRTLLIFQSYKFPTDVDYFKYVVFLLFEIEKTKAPGGTIKTITKEVLTDFIVPIPCLKEQQKIATFLSSIDAKIETTTQQINQMQYFKKGLLQQMFV